MQKSHQKSPSGHHRATLSGYIFATKTRINNRQKKLLSSNISSTIHMSSQYGELRPTNAWDRLTSLGHPCRFQLVSCLGSITARHLVVGVSQTLRCWTEGATYILQGDHHVGHWPTFLVIINKYVCVCVCICRLLWMSMDQRAMGLCTLRQKKQPAHPSRKSTECCWMARKCEYAGFLSCGVILVSTKFFPQICCVLTVISVRQLEHGTMPCLLPGQM